jgi:hypothetical protein
MQKSPPARHITRRFATHAIGWGVFAALLAYGWNVSHLALNVPNYDDVLEALWGIELYYNSLVGHGVFPTFLPAIWHPLGLHMGSLGVTPAVFLISLPLRMGLGSAALTYNVLALSAFTLSFAASQRFARELLPAPHAYLAALLFAFAPFHWERLNGHININLGLAVLPLAALFALRLARASDRVALRNAAVGMGLCWGVTASLQLYGLWWGGLLWLCVVLARVRRPHLGVALLAPLLAVLIVAPTLLYFTAGNRAMDQITDRLPALVGWGSSVNSLFVPSVVHPLPPLQALSKWLYYGIPNESGNANWGVLLPVCALAGALLWRRADAGNVVRSAMGAWVVIGLVLSLGYAVKWHGDIVQTEALTPLNRALWSAGQTLKPALFDTPDPQAGLDRAVPLPAYALLITVPGWESARVLPRFGFVAALGLVVFAAAFLRRLPKAAALLLAALLLIEVVPAPTGDLPVPRRAHPAYTWAREQDASGANNVLDITDEPKVVPLIVGGAVAYAQQLHGLPVASGLSSYLPRAVDTLALRLGAAPEWTQDPETARLLDANKTRFVFVHMLFHWDTRVWDGLSHSPHYVSHGCFDGEQGDVFVYTICVAERTTP